MNGPREAAVDLGATGAQLELEAVFQAHYGRVARTIAGVIRDPARVEELAVEVFLKWSRTSSAQGQRPEGWLQRAAVRTGLDELRRQARRSRFEALLGFARQSPTPEDLRSAKEEQEKVRRVLAAMAPRQAEMLLLRQHGFSYDELAAALGLNPASIGTFLSRAQLAFRKEYTKRYGGE